MTATGTLHQVPAPNNSKSIPFEPLRPRHGVITLRGYGSSVRVDRGHLVLREAIAGVRREARLPRVGHGLRRLVVIGSDGMVSFAALRWLAADQKAAFVMLDRDGTVLLVTGPTGPNDARLRRAQALAGMSGTALVIARDLIGRKLAEQERLVRDVFNNGAAATAITVAQDRLQSAGTIESMRVLESQAALAYWSCWRDLPVLFPKSDLSRVPDHWRTFGARISPLTGSPRLAVNPSGAMLNYLYAVLESEARLAASALGLDPGLGVMHADTKARDSLACDLMEPIRPRVDAFVLDWLTQQPLRRDWYFEQPNGNCRLMGSFAERLSETAPMWARAVAPIAERVAKVLWSANTGSRRAYRPPTLLTQAHRRAAKGALLPAVPSPQRPPRLCRMCGGALGEGQSFCGACNMIAARGRMPRVAEQGRIAAQRPDAQARRTATRLRNAEAERAWKPSEQPAWLTERVYREQILPRLAGFSAARLSSALGVSAPYAVDIRAGRRRPHPRHWRAVAELAGVSNA